MYDVAVIGGGLAGLSLAIQLARKNYAVVLFEKEKYPFHRVCGEYISMESWNFLEQLGVPLSSLNLPRIGVLDLIAPNGLSFTTPLPLGGFGISRYKIDHLLFSLAREAGVLLLEETKVENLSFGHEKFCIQYTSRNQSGPGQLEAALCCGAFGKRSNLDVKWNRDHLQKDDPRLSNYIAVKYHVRTAWPRHVIGLLNFSDGYCGISKVEDDAYCLCYLTTAQNLKRSNNSIARMQEEILFKNPVLKKVFTESDFDPGFPVTISQISFRKKSIIENHVLMAGDSAGMIAPLCGNGMSMALHSSKIAAGQMHLFLQKRISRVQMETFYEQEWKREFSGRLRMGRWLQGFFGSEGVTNLFVRFFKTFPFLAGGVIKMTHGKSF